VEVEKSHPGAQPDFQRAAAGTAPGQDLIGGIERGFDFLGYHFEPDGLTMARKTIEKVFSRAIRLYEQGPGEAIASARLGL